MKFYNLINRKFGFATETEEELIKLKYDDIYDFHEGLAAVELNEKWGFINDKGEEVIKPKYHFAYDFYKGHAIVVLNNKFGIIDTKGIVICDIKYDYIIISFYNGYGKMLLNNNMYFIDYSNGEELPFTNRIPSTDSYDDLYYAKYKDSYILTTDYFIGNLKDLKEIVNKKYNNKNIYEHYMQIINKLEMEND